MRFSSIVLFLSVILPNVVILAQDTETTEAVVTTMVTLVETTTNTTTETTTNTTTDTTTDTGGMETMVPSATAMGDTSSPVVSSEMPTAIVIETLSPTTSAGCYDSLDSVYALIGMDELLFTTKNIVLCPDTFYDIGDLIPGIGILGGQAPIVPRSNTYIKCGEDGKSSNNCILRGGGFSVLSLPVFFSQDLYTSNVVLEGLTFQSQNVNGAFLGNPGDITFLDCIWQDFQAFGPVYISYFDPSMLRRELVEEVIEMHDSPWDRAYEYMERVKALTTKDHEEHRKLLEERNDLLSRNLQDDSTAKVLEVNFVGCVFQRNKQLPEISVGAFNGIVTIGLGAHDVVIEDCTFMDNEFGDEDIAPNGYAILVEMSKATIIDTCFINNDFSGQGVVVVELTEDFSSENVYVSDNDDTTCSYVAYYATEEDKMNFAFECIDADAETCAADDEETMTDGTDTDTDSGTTEANNTASAGSSSRYDKLFVTTTVSILAVVAYFA